MAVQEYVSVLPVLMIPSCVKLCLVSVAVSCVLLSPGAHSLQDKHTTLTHPRDRRDASAQPTASASGDLTNIIRHLSSSEMGNLDLMQYTPSTPSPEDVNCYVEVPVTRRVGGRCVSLGSNAMGCQAGVYLALSSQCQSQGPLPRRRLGVFSRRRHLNRRRYGAQP